MTFPSVDFYKLKVSLGIPNIWINLSIKTKTNMKKNIIFALLCSFLSHHTKSFAQDDQSVYDQIWSKALLYQEDENSLLSKFVLTGRLQGDYHSFENDETGESASDFDWRRFRFGFKASILDGFTLHSEANLNLNQPEPLYTNLTDTYLSWTTDNGLKFKVGKQSAPFTLDGSTSSKKLHTLERGKIATNIWFGQEYFPGVSVSGSNGEWDYFAGVYSSDNAPEFADAFDYGKFGIVSLGRDWAESFGYDKALIRFDVMLQDDDEMKYKDWDGAYSLVSKWQKGKVNLWTDLSFADRENGDVVGLQIMPFYDITDQTQIIFCYTSLDSSDKDQLKKSRWEHKLDGAKGSELSEYYFGLNYFFYGHKLKWQNGLQYTTLEDSSGSDQYEGWGFTTAFRLSW